MKTDINASELQANPPRYMSVRETALYLTTSERFLRGQIADRRIRFAKVGGRMILRREDLDLFLESRLSDLPF
jgi:excisionase family DNA binding protein